MKTISLVSCLLIAFVAKSQIQAVTSNGDEVILHENKTWEYASKDKNEAHEIPTNKTKFSKADKSTFLIKSNIVKVGVYLDPKKWSFKKADAGEAAEYTFELKEKDAYGMLISERTEIPIEGLKNIALENARKAAPDIRIIKEEYRTVNGIRVLCMQMNGTIQGAKFAYYGYYYSSEKGTVQFLTYTAQNLLTEYLPEMEGLLNGFIATD